MTISTVETPRILMVDDSATARMVARRALEARGYRVECARDVWIASTISEFKPDLILMDVNLGVIGKGPTVVSSIRGRDFLGSAKIFLHSSLPAAELETLSQECGADGWIEKSSDPHELVDRLDEILGR